MTTVSMSAGLNPRPRSPSSRRPHVSPYRPPNSFGSSRPTPVSSRIRRSPDRTTAQLIGTGTLPFSSSCTTRALSSSVTPAYTRSGSSAKSPSEMIATSREPINILVAAIAVRAASRTRASRHAREHEVEPLEIVGLLEWLVPPRQVGFQGLFERLLAVKHPGAYDGPAWAGARSQLSQYKVSLRVAQPLFG